MLHPPKMKMSLFPPRLLREVEQKAGISDESDFGAAPGEAAPSRGCQQSQHINPKVKPYSERLFAYPLLIQQFETPPELHLEPSRLPIGRFYTAFSRGFCNGRRNLMKRFNILLLQTDV